MDWQDTPQEREERCHPMQQKKWKTLLGSPHGLSSLGVELEAMRQGGQVPSCVGDLRCRLGNQELELEGGRQRKHWRLHPTQQKQWSHVGSSPHELVSLGVVLEAGTQGKLALSRLVLGRRRRRLENRGLGFLWMEEWGLLLWDLEDGPIEQST